MVTGRADLLGEARLLALSSDDAVPDAVPLDAATVLRMATVLGAHALGFHLSGEVLPGHNADLVLVDTQAPRGVPGRDLVSTLLYCAAEDGVTDVMIAGRWIVRNRRLQTNG